MEMTRVLGKKASEYVATFEPSLTIESGIIKRYLRTNIEEVVADLDNGQRSVFYQCVLEDLNILQERVTNKKPINELELDEIELQILSIQKLLKNSNHQTYSDITTSSLPAKKQQNLEVRQQIALDYIFFLGGVNSQNTPIMSQREFKNLTEYTNYLIQYEELPTGTEPIKPVKISKDHIKYSYYLIYKELRTDKLTVDVFIKFLQIIFQDFESKPVFSTLKAKFSVGPKSYVADIENIKVKLVK